MVTAQTLHRRTVSRAARIRGWALAAGLLGLVCGRFPGNAESMDALDILPPVQVGEDPATATIRDALRADHYDAAALAVEKLSHSSGDTGRSAYWAGLVDLRTGKFQNAIRSFRRSMAASRDPYTLEGLALAYYSVRQFHLFEQTMMQAAALLPNAFAPPYYLGRYYVSVDVADFARAKTYFAAAVERRPSHALALYYLGFSEECLGEIESSIAAYKKALTLSSNSSKSSELSYLGLARTSLLRGTPEDAIAYARHAGEMMPSDPDVYKLLGRLYRQTGQPEAAITQWKTAASLDPTSTAPYYNLYRLYRQTNQAALADAAMATYKEMATLYGTD